MPPIEHDKNLKIGGDSSRTHLAGIILKVGISLKLSKALNIIGFQVLVLILMVNLWRLIPIFKVKTLI